MAFNSKEYSWADIKVVLLGREVTGIRAVEYKTKHQKELLYAAGRKARSVQWGKKEHEGTITVLQSELIALDNAAKAKGWDDVTDMDFDIIVSYIPSSGIISTDKILQASITEIPKSFKEGDLFLEIALPFIALHIEHNVI
ncbi:hypothetical protein EZS27_015563 [termite gut metagenome]|uniref:Uncharacterized protein n=1 Tax=termite gut metagenome TaxID=433724 RepID=A0A5J4RQR5_9ZZZZ